MRVVDRLLTLVYRRTEPRCGHRITQPVDRRKAVATMRRAGHAYVEHVIAKRYGGQIVEGWKSARVVGRRA